MNDEDFAYLLHTFKFNDVSYSYYSLEELEREGLIRSNKLPYSIRILLEGALRKCNGEEITCQKALELAAWTPRTVQRPTMSFYPERIILQDLTGVPVITDLAALRSAFSRKGHNPKLINPLIPVDLVIDHSIQVDYFGNEDSLECNKKLEFSRNIERYSFLKWAQKAFKNIRVVPPGNGIIHQINLEFLSRVILSLKENSSNLIFPETLVGTDSHTTMINGLGVVGWGVGGIEAIAAMLGHALELPIPDVIGIKLTGALPEFTTPSDLTLRITELLREKNVVDKFIEFTGDGVNNLTLADRAMVANMAPEYGATLAYFPVDDRTLQYLQLTGRKLEHIALVEKYFKTQNLFRTKNAPSPEFSDLIKLDLCSIVPSVAGPKRPQDWVPLGKVKSSFQYALSAPRSQRGYGLSPENVRHFGQIMPFESTSHLEHGSVVIAAITSCTTTSNPFSMIAAGLLAKKALEKGLKVKSYIKTSFAPGSRVVVDYLANAGLMEPLEQLGFSLVGFGCTTCIGNSGPLPEEIAEEIRKNKLVVSAVLSGNRNFEGRIHPSVQANYLASPPLVIAYALAGTMNVDLTQEPIGNSNSGTAVFIQDIWPSNVEIQHILDKNINTALFQISSTEDLLFQWDPKSTYIQEPSFLWSQRKSAGILPITNAHALAIFGDSITTDHISPAGLIPENSPAGQYLLSNGIQVKDYNTYGARRGNYEVMVRGTFANIRLKNRLIPEIEGGHTMHMPDGEQMSIFDCAMRYKKEGVPMIILAGKEYGIGSSRDWAAKGQSLLGIRAVIAESFERIHRSNLVGMGILPLQFRQGENVNSLGLTGHETYTIEHCGSLIEPGTIFTIIATNEKSHQISFQATAQINSEKEVAYIQNGGILPTILNIMEV